MVFDECNGHSIQRSIIHALSTALLRHRVPLILFIASRPEPHIRSAFNAFEISHSSHHIVLDDSYHPDADIKIFLSSRFKEIRENHPLATFIPESWPSANTIDQLVQKSSGQFIYASTVIKYLDSPNHKPMKRLDVIIGLIPVSGDAPYKQLDTLYAHIFSCVKDITGALQIIGFLIFGRNDGDTTPEFLECLFGLEEGDGYLRLSELHSILDIPPPLANRCLEKPIKIFHASLGDFLFDRFRAGDYYLDEVMVHTNIAEHCLPRLMTSVNKCRRETTVDRTIAYSNENFVYHCSRASTNSESLKDKLMQHDFYKLFAQYHCDSDHYFVIPPFFEWLDKTDDRLRSHVQHLWDRSFLDALNKCTFSGNKIDLAVILIFPRQWVLLWLELSGREYPDVLKNYPLYNGVKKLYIDFFEDRNRSGIYHLDGNIYARTALECIQHIFNLEGPGMTLNMRPFITDIKRPPDLSRSVTISTTPINFHRSALDSYVTLLSMASPLDSLYSILRNHRFKAGSHLELDVLDRLNSAVETYLEKCRIEQPQQIERPQQIGRPSKRQRRPIFKLHRLYERVAKLLRR